MGLNESKVCRSNLSKYYLSNIACKSTSIENNPNKKVNNEVAQKESIELDENSIDKSLSIEKKNNLINEIFINEKSEKENDKTLSNAIEDLTNQTNPAISCLKAINGFSLSNKYKKFLDKKIKKSYHKKNSESNTITIFDWDDTLFPTTFIMQKMKNSLFSLNFSKIENEKVRELEKKINTILTQALDKGIVFIVTNSEEGWVENCVRIYYPDLIPLLDNVNIISARALYGKEFPYNKEMWKMRTFIELPKYLKIDHSLKTNIICFGDSNLEIISAKIFAKEFSDHILKTVKFLENPDLFQLIKQIQLVELGFNIIYNFHKNLNIAVGKKAI